MINNNNSYDFNGLIILELANNHQGSVAHAKKIINTLAPITKEAGVKAAIKFQLRDLDTFIHPEYKDSTEFKHIPRFLSTRLKKDEFGELTRSAKNAGLVTMATPFDEVSVDVLLDLGIDLIKIASSSATDWPLLEKIATAGLPVVCSTAGLPLEFTDNLVSFFEHKGVDYALLHCVSIYPTPEHKLNLQRIYTLKTRYPNVTIGYSTHEAPDAMEPVMVAYAKGARIFEKHVGMKGDGISLNAYSATPEQVAKWLSNYNRVISMVGSETNVETPKDKDERVSLISLRRGVYLKKTIKKGIVIRRDDVFFAMPLLKGQLPSGQWHSADWKNANYTHNNQNAGLVADKNYKANEPLSDSIVPKQIMKKEIIYRAIHAIKGMLSTAGISVNRDATVTVIHPHGIRELSQSGACHIESIAREYEKRISVMLPGQSLPKHYHTKKERTLQILYGDIEVEINGSSKILRRGDTISISPGEWQRLDSKHGTIFEVMSLKVPDDSVIYMKKELHEKNNDGIQTKLVNWGRHQFDDNTEVVSL